MIACHFSKVISHGELENKEAICSDQIMPALGENQMQVANGEVDVKEPQYQSALWGKRVKLWIFDWVVIARRGFRSA
jgi:hypothetical protein